MTADSKRRGADSCCRTTDFFGKLLLLSVNYRL